MVDSRVLLDELFSAEVLVATILVIILKLDMDVELAILGIKGSSQLYLTVVATFEGKFDQIDQ